MSDAEDDEKTDPAIILPTKTPKNLQDVNSSKYNDVIEIELEDAAIPTASPPVQTPEPPPKAAAPATQKMPEFGLIAPFMKDPEITEVMVNDLRNIIVEKNGQMFLTGTRFTSVDELNRLARNILDITGRILSPDHPYIDAMLPDGSRVNLVGQPLTQQGVCITIRKFPAIRFTLDDLVKKGPMLQMLDDKMAYFLQCCVLGRLNIVVSGGTSSGKTTLLNALIGTIPQAERVVCIEDIPELIVSQLNHVSLQTKPAMLGSPAVSARDLVVNALRMRPDRIILGECRRGEALDMLQAMNTGHDGSMTTVHANSTRDALARLETLCLMGGVELPLSAIRRQIRDSIDVLVHVKRMRDGARKVTAISEISGMEGEVITMQEIFRIGTDGQFQSSGLVPTFMNRLKENGVELPSGFF